MTTISPNQRENEAKHIENLNVNMEAQLIEDG